MGAGAPLGNRNAANAKRWSAAIERAIERYPTKSTPDGKNELMIGLDAAADTFVQQMMEAKDLGFFREFGDRLDGKSVQQSEVNLTADITARAHQLSDDELAEIASRGAKS